MVHGSMYKDHKVTNIRCKQELVKQAIYPKTKIAKERGSWQT